MLSDLEPRSPNGQEPGISRRYVLTAFSGLEPMLGGGRRPRIDRSLFLALLEIDPQGRLEAVMRVLELGVGRFYGVAIRSVFRPRSLYSYEQKLAAMDSLVRLDPERALGGLILAWSNCDLDLQRAAISCMRRLESEVAEKVLIAILDDPRPIIRHEAMRALATRWSLPILMELLSSSGVVVSRAAGWLAEHGCPHVLAVLVAALRDRRRDAVDQAIAQRTITAAIGRLGQRLGPERSAPMVQALRNLLDDRQTDERLARRVCQALHQIGTEEAMAVAIVYQAAFSGMGAG